MPVEWKTDGIETGDICIYIMCVIEKTRAGEQRGWQLRRRRYEFICFYAIKPSLKNQRAVKFIDHNIASIRFFSDRFYL